MDANIGYNRFKIIVFLMGIFAAWSLLTPGFIPTHDGEYHLIRFFEFDKNIRAGNFFPRWAPGLNSGFGVPLFNFFYPFPNYVGEFFHLLGFSFIDSFKLTLAAGLILSGLFFYLWVAEVWGKWGGIVGAIFYILAPYHLVDVYVRGSPGEVWALVWLPGVLWGLEKLIRSQKMVFFVLSSLFLAFLILSHNILAMIFILFIISYVIFLILTLPQAQKLSAIRYPLSAIFLGLGLAAYFWLPALVEAKYVTGLRFINFADHFPAFSQLLLPSWGAGFSVPGINDQISFQIGIPHLLMTLLAIFLLLRKRKQKDAYLSFLLLWFLVVFILLLEISLPLWRMIPVMFFIQYPWRLLSLMILVTSTLAAIIVSQKKTGFLPFLLIALALIFYGSYARPIKYLARSDDFYLSNPVWTDGTATLGDSFNTIWLKKRPKHTEKRIIFPQEECQVIELFKNPIKYDFKVNCFSTTPIQLGIAYFPGWEVLVDGKEIPIDFVSGLINFQVPEGKQTIEVEFGETPIRTLANRISFISLLFLGGTAIFLRGKAIKG